LNLILVQVELQFRKNLKNCSSSAGITVHHKPESLFTLRQNQCSDWARICNSDSLAGFQSSNEFLQCVGNHQFHPHLIAASQVEGTGADGGFIVPQRLATDLFDGALESEIIRPRARVFPMDSNALNIAGIDNLDHSSSIGNLQGRWMGEKESATIQTSKFREITLRAHKLGLFTNSSSELAEDGLNFESQLTQAMTAALSFDLDDALINGDGVAKPLGILNAASTIEIAKEAGQSADTIVYSNIVKMWSRLHPGLSSNSIWIISPTVLPQLFSLSFEGTSTSVPAYLPASAGIGQSPTPTLMGRPVLMSEKAATLGDRGDIILANLSQYAVGLRRDLTIQSSIHSGFQDDSIDWRLIARVDGRPLWDRPITPRNGDSLSWCVTLAERA